MASCNTSEILTLGAVRSYLQIPDPRTCGRKTVYYGKDCQFLEIDGVTRNVRNAGTPIRTWNRRTKSYCTIATTSTPPDNPQITGRFYEPCEKGIPLSHTLGECRLRIINNYGLCKSTGNVMDSWSSYSEILDVQVLSENRGRRSSYDGTDEPLTNEITFELLNIYDIGPMIFSPVNLSGGACPTPTLTFNNAAFGCQTGCGQSSCGCSSSCDDGTMSMYIPASCGGGSAQYLAYSNNGGETLGGMLVIPDPGVGTPTANPIVAVMGSTLYVLVNENPTTLMSVELDSYGRPTGSFTTICTLAEGSITTGKPAAMKVDGDALHILVNDSTNGSRYYTLDSVSDPCDGPRYTYPAAANVDTLAACGSNIIAGGDAGALYTSIDGGSGWSQAVGNSSADVTSVGYSDRFWASYADGNTYTSSDGGYSWSTIAPRGKVGAATKIKFFGDDIGWLLDSGGAPMSTWLGGINSNEWTRSSNRVSNIPSGFTAEDIIVPECASSVLAANTALLIGKDASGASVAYIGRSPVTGI